MTVKYNYSEADDLYDQNILTKDLCPKCGARIVSCPDCTTFCSDDNCDFEER